MENMSAKEPMLTVAEVIAMAGVSRWTLFKDTEAGKIDAVHFGRNVRFRRSDAEKYAEEKALIKGSKVQGDVNYYSTQDLMETFQISRTTIYRAIKSGKLVVSKRAGNANLFDEESLNNYLKSSKKKA